MLYRLVSGVGWGNGDASPTRASRWEEKGWRGLHDSSAVPPAWRGAPALRHGEGERQSHPAQEGAPQARAKLGTFPSTGPNPKSAPYPTRFPTRFYQLSVLRRIRKAGRVGACQLQDKRSRHDA